MLFPLDFIIVPPLLLWLLFLLLLIHRLRPQVLVTLTSLSLHSYPPALRPSQGGYVTVGVIVFSLLLLFVFLLLFFLLVCLFFFFLSLLLFFLLVCLFFFLWTFAGTLAG